MAMRTADFRVSGKVQGVFFRAFVRNTAQDLRIVGWVKNEPSGDVVGTAQGPEDALTKFKEALHQGPPQAHVSGVQFSNESALERPQYQGFEKVKNHRAGA
ncbi:acylphosphatase isozyme Ch1 [Epithele typhae]|uniref:acylphosphatase isozyme Ch1 n=1 Tax=Epithele typhae TaxID=378194 RepID=UPI002007E662|nr:acylphosphatase isozyme Ch1 [Epithele typhae]KAH9912755.1 acylphosphatase isozyme Ch1 [Epithele typhae]